MKPKHAFKEPWTEIIFPKSVNLKDPIFKFRNYLKAWGKKEFKVRLIKKINQQHDQQTPSY